VVHVVEKVVIESESRADCVEQPWRVVEILRRGPDVFGRNRGVRRLVIQSVFRHAVGRRESRDTGLCADGLVSEIDVARHFVERFGDVLSIGMAVDHHAVAALPAEQFVQRHSRHLALEVPQRRIDGGDRAHRHRPAAPVRAAIEVLPDILDPRRIATDEGRDDVLGEIGRDGELATIERSVPDSMEALVRFDLQRDKIPARATDDDPAVRYFHACTVDKESRT
jgi:hypothetical protein